MYCQFKVPLRANVGWQSDWACCARFDQRAATAHPRSKRWRVSVNRRKQVLGTQGFSRVPMLGPQLCFAPCIFQSWWLLLLRRCIVDIIFRATAPGGCSAQKPICGEREPGHSAQSTYLRFFHTYSNIQTCCFFSLVHFIFTFHVFFIFHSKPSCVITCVKWYVYIVVLLLV